MSRALGALVLALAACTAVEADGPNLFTTLDGRALLPLDVPAGRVRVLVFVAHDCPIANSYAPLLERLWRDLRGTEADLVLVHVDPDLDMAGAAQHAREYGLTMPIVLDPGQTLAAAVGATVTPEAAVLTSRGLQYLGRIDDRWRGLGQDSQQAERDDLRRAVAAVREGRAIAEPRTPAIGCLLPEPRR